MKDICIALLLFTMVGSAGFGVGYLHAHKDARDYYYKFTQTKCERGYIQGFLDAGGTDSNIGRFTFEEACKRILK